MKEEQIKKKYACFFGGAQNNTDSLEYKESVLIGELLAKKGFIVKNGGYRGLMEAVSKGAYQQGGIVLGYTCKSFGSTKGNCYLTENIVSESLFERLEKLISNSDIFIVQKGGVGTLSELFLTLDLIRKISKKERPRIYLLGKHWEKLKAVLVSFGLQNDMGILKIVEDFKKLKECL
ncbi:LOG family protein [Chryseobacterium candidae]|uniref:LOG family protein n=1 Tax=Chryseobacterium candidae TaxID=1978493 RepID=A0ABY2R2G1_9FLAO|nr:LOG family protein [Chryseobacterium candidae]THV56523.1 LOG family protein [Chryseobacterium candidae]